MRCDVLAIGTELLLGQIVDTNSAWIGEHLADAVIVCGGLGPTPDDVTREAIAEVMGVELERREELVEQIRAMFGSRGREMPANNLRQAEVPVGGDAIPNPIGTAPGVRCEVEIGGATKVVYAVPGVPYEMTKMVTEQVLPDLLARSGQRSVIVSRSLKTWGASESGLAEMIAARVDQQTNPTIAFLARGIEGIYVRMTAKAATEAEAAALLDAEDVELRKVLGDLVFAVDYDTMESTVLGLCEARGWTLGVGESLTGGFIGARLANVPGASRVFRGAVASYATEVKRSILGVTAPLVVTEEAAKEMAVGARRALGASVGISVTGVAGPDEMEGQPVGSVWYGLAIPGHEPEAIHAQMPGDRERIRQFSTIGLLNLLRMRLLALP